MATTDVPRTALGRALSHNPDRCQFCNAPLRMRYPGGDPENGPARPSCGKPWCDRARDAAEEAHHYSMTDGTTLDDLHDEALHEDLFEGYGEQSSVGCPTCGHVDPAEIEALERAAGWDPNP